MYLFVKKNRCEMRVVCDRENNTKTFVFSGDELKCRYEITIYQTAITIPNEHYSIQIK
jgi:hypothetical protein